MRILLIGKGKMGQTFLNLFPNEVSSFIDVSSALSLEKDDFEKCAEKIKKMIYR